MSGRDLASEVAFLTRALKAPTLREAVPRLAERAREQSWTHEEFLIACLQREVAARDSHGGEGRVVADHERIWAKHQTISAEEHVTAARALRAARVGLLRPPPPADQVEIRSLSDYDTALGLTDGGVA